MSKLTLYFLRSSEQKIATDMLRYSMRLNELNKSLADFPQLSIYEKFYGLSTKDLGLYALVDNKIAGAVWVRLLKEEDDALAYVDANTPILNIAVIPEFRKKGIASAMLEQLLQEAGAVFEQISVSLVQDSHAVKLFEKFGFTKVLASDGYDPRRWMD